MRKKALAARWRVLDELLAQGDWCSQSDLFHATGLPKQTIVYALRDLRMGRLVELDMDDRALTRSDGSVSVRTIKVYRAVIRRIK